MSELRGRPDWSVRRDNMIATDFLWRVYPQEIAATCFRQNRDMRGFYRNGPSDSDDAATANLKNLRWADTLEMIMAEFKKSSQTRYLSQWGAVG